MNSDVDRKGAGHSGQPPSEYLEMEPADRIERIRHLKARLGTQVLILGHHYVSDDIIQFADRRGDSYALAKEAAAVEDARTIVFCGVHFMAESADILTPPDKIVVMPDPGAGCPLADMASIEDVASAWLTIADLADSPVVPVTYVNSSAALKNFVGRHEGAVCTSSNAARVIQWALAPGGKLFFFPDQHLGRNTCHALGIPLSRMALWDPEQPSGGCTADELRQAQVILWKGHCPIHQRFTAADVARWRAARPGIRVAVHPECPFDVVQAADHSGSTAELIRLVDSAEPGSAWAIGTEANLVERLRSSYTDRFVTHLSPVPSVCEDMHKNRLPGLLWVLENLSRGVVVNRVTVDEEIAQGARTALRRMISI